VWHSMTDVIFSAMGEATMRLTRSLVGGALAVMVVGLATQALAQGGGGGNDVNEEVRRAVERAVGASVSTSVAESLSRSIVSEGLQVEPKTTVFGSPFYNRTTGDFDFGSFKADTGGATVGFLQKINEYVLLHGAVAGSATHTRVDVAGMKSTVNANFIDGRIGGDFVFLNSPQAKGWFTMEGGLNRFATDVEGSKPIASWMLTPSATLSLRGGPILFEPVVAFGFTRPFDGVPEDNDVTITFQPGFSLKYRGERFRPQLNFQYSKVVNPEIVASNDDGTISVGPEILYAITPSVLVGGAYSYSRPLTKGIDVNSHTVTLEIRWIF
jgi:hypothetical protein